MLDSPVLQYITRDNKTAGIVTLGDSRASASAVSVTVGRPPQHSSFRNDGTKQGNERSKLPTRPKVHVRGLLFSRNEKLTAVKRIGVLLSGAETPILDACGTS